MGLLGHVLQSIGALSSDNRPPGLSGLATAVTSPATVLSLDVEQAQRQKYAQGLDAPEVKSFRDLAMRSSLLGDTQGVVSAQQHIALELQRKGLNPDQYFKTEGLVHQAILTQAKGMHEGQKVGLENTQRQIIAQAQGDPQAILQGTQQAANQGLLNPKAFTDLTGMGGSIRGGQIAAGGPITAERLQAGGGQMASEGYPMNALPAGFKGGQPGVVPFETRLSQEAQLARARNEAEAQVRFEHMLDRAKEAGAITGAQSAAELQTKASPGGLAAQGAINSNNAASTEQGKLLGGSTPSALQNRSLITATDTAAREGARIGTQARPENLENRGKINQAGSYGTAVGQEQGKIDVQTQPGNAQKLNDILRNQVTTRTLAAGQATEELNMKPARSMLDTLTNVYSAASNSLPSGGGLNRMLKNAYNTRVAMPMQLDPSLTTADATSKAALSVFARAIGRQGANLAENEQQRMEAVVPQVTDSREVVAAKLGLLQKLTTIRLDANEQPVNGLAAFQMGDLFPPQVQDTASAISYLQQTYGVGQEAAITILRGLDEMEQISARSYKGVR